MTKVEGGPAPQHPVYNWYMRLVQLLWLSYKRSTVIGYLGDIYLNVPFQRKVGRKRVAQTNPGPGLAARKSTNCANLSCEHGHVGIKVT